MTIGEMVKSMLVKLEWFDTRFPRIPVNVQVIFLFKYRSDVGHSYYGCTSFRIFVISKIFICRNKSTLHLSKNITKEIPGILMLTLGPLQIQMREALLILCQEIHRI